MGLSVAFPSLRCLFSRLTPPGPPPAAVLSAVILGSGIRAVAMGTSPIQRHDDWFGGDEREKRGEARGRGRKPPVRPRGGGRRWGAVVKRKWEGGVLVSHGCCNKWLQTGYSLKRHMRTL